MQSFAAWGVLVLATAMAFAYFALVRAAGLEAELAETNFQANMIRYGDYFHEGPHEAALAGTSISGRVLPQYFSEDGLDLANLGLDGAMVATSVGVFARHPSPPPLLMVEMRTLGNPAGANDAQLVAALETPSFRMASFLPPMRAAYRPSSIVYTRLKLARDGSLGGGKALPKPSSQSIRAGMLASAPRTHPSPPPDDPTVNRLLELERAGVRIVLVHLPDGRPLAKSTPSAFGMRVHQSTGWPVLNVPKMMLEAGYEPSYTDGLHMAAPTSRMSARMLAKALRRLDED